MKLALYTAPTIDPVSVQELKDHLRIDAYDDDSYVAAVLGAAVAHVEDITRRKLMTQTWDYYLSLFPSNDYIELPFGNLKSVASVKYKDSDGTETTMVVTTDYIVETNGEGIGRIVLPDGVSWPSDSLYPSNPITIRFTCGWATAATVPSTIKAAVKLVAADLYEMRGEPVIGSSVVENKTVDRLLASCRLWGNFE